METIYYTATETAKLIRKELKMLFPTVKFSVRTESRGTIYVSFTGTKLLGEAVNNLVRKYRGCDFDGMTDSKNYITHELADGRKVKYGSDFIFVFLSDIDSAA